jgi:4-amino-4-deoxy-L-arabinose transferase-like glycosyltransferase
VTRDVGRTPEPPVLMALSALLGLWNLSVNGWANTYYSGAMRAMSTSWHDFLFASLDKSGLMTLDKPPLGLWVQALSVRVFGPHPLSVLAPQVLTGVVATALLYDLTRRRFGRLAGFVAGLALATTPVIVAVSRHNNPDELLVLCSVAALWCFVAALERGVTKCLVLSAVCVGLGFETKMLVAFMIVPGMAVAWLWAAPVPLAARLRRRPASRDRLRQGARRRHDRGRESELGGQRDPHRECCPWPVSAGSRAGRAR